MLARNDQFSQEMRKAFIEKTDIVEMCDQIATTFDKHSNLLTLTIKMKNKYLRDEQISDDEEIYAGHLNRQEE